MITLERYKQVAGVLARHGLADLLHARLPAKGDPTRPERLRQAAVELGATFIKAGQYLSTRPDLLETEYRRELAKLQDDVPSFSGAEARRIVEAELGAPIAELFAGFSARPLAAASIAQVHEAELPDGTPVVVKIRRPGVSSVVSADLGILAGLSALAERHSRSWRARRPTEFVDELSRALDRELDFSIEAAHIERFARQTPPDARAPRVYRELSSPRVLTMERLQGLKPDDLEGLRAAGVEPAAVAAALGRQYLEMIFVHGFFHADPHPGNFLVGPGPVIGYVDFGLMGRLDLPARERLAGVLLAVVERDERRLGRELLALARYDEAPDEGAFEADVAELMDQYAYRPLSEWRLGRMFEQLFDVSARHRVRVPRELFLMVKTLSELEGLIRRLDPGFDAVAAAAPFVRRLQEQRLEPARVARELGESAWETVTQLRELIRQARRGRLELDFEHKGLEPALALLDKVSNRLSFAVLLASLVIGSSLLIHSGMSRLGTLGFTLSGAMALWLLAAILRHGRL